MIDCGTDYGAFVVGTIESKDDVLPEDKQVLAVGDEVEIDEVVRVWTEGEWSGVRIPRWDG
jgi:hypothetical protein